jgi:hypothetical protein
MDIGASGIFSIFIVLPNDLVSLGHNQAPFDVKFRVP